MNDGATTRFVLPRAGKGRRSEAAEARYQEEMDAFCTGILEMQSSLDIRVGIRGWCYLLENAGIVTKGEFDRVERLITSCRKSGKLPLDICAEDDAREFDGVEDLDEMTSTEYASAIVNDVLGRAHRRFKPISFWDAQDCYLQLVVEKIDLKSLFAGICQEFRIPHANSRGWGDLHIRANMMQRFKHWEAQGKQCVLLYCGDLDPVGLKISDCLKDNMAELGGAVRWSPEHLIIDRFGLNKAFIEAYLPDEWIDGLWTGSGENLADPNHRDHDKAYVQDYLAQYGARKVEANAMVIRPEPSRALFRETILRYVSEDAPARYQARLRPHQEEARQETIRLLRERIL